jgi:hypothetical protein
VHRHAPSKSSCMLVLRSHSALHMHNECCRVQSVRERIEDKRKAVLGAMSPMGQDHCSQRHTQPEAAREHHATFTELLSAGASPRNDTDREQPAEPQQHIQYQDSEHDVDHEVPASLTDRLRNSLASHANKQGQGLVSGYHRSAQAHSQVGHDTGPIYAASPGRLGMLGAVPGQQILQSPHSNSPLSPQFLNSLRATGGSGTALLHGGSQAGSQHGGSSQGSFSMGGTYRSGGYDRMGASFGSEQLHIHLGPLRSPAPLPSVHTDSGWQLPGSRNTKRRRTDAEAAATGQHVLQRMPTAHHFHRDVPGKAQPILIDPGAAGVTDSWLGVLGMGSLSEPLRGQPIGYVGSVDGSEAAVGRGGGQALHVALQPWPEAVQMQHQQPRPASPPVHGALISLLRGEQLPCPLLHDPH